MREVGTNAELAALYSAGYGVVFNDFTTGPAAARDNVLHAADCVWVGRMLARAVPERRPSVRKIFFDTGSEAVAWLQQHRGQEGQAWKHCAGCGAGRLAAGGRPQVPSHAGGPAAVPAAAAMGAIRSPGVPRQKPVTAAELDRLTEACRPFQVLAFAYEHHDS